MPWVKMDASCMHSIFHPSQIQRNVDSLPAGTFPYKLLKYAWERTYVTEQSLDGEKFPSIQRAPGICHAFRMDSFILFFYLCNIVYRENGLL